MAWPTLDAQAVLTGVVRDADGGAVLGGALVSLPEFERTARAGPDGRYRINGVGAGPVHLTVRAIGYRLRSLHAIVPSDGTLEIDITLQRTPLQLSAVDVRAPALAGTDREEPTAIAPDRTRTDAQVRQHPLLAEPDVLQALGGGAVALRAEAPSGIHVRGSASHHTAFVLDGIPILEPFHGGGVFSAWNPDAVSQVRLSSAAASPSLPPTLSGAVDADTRRPVGVRRTRGGLSTTQARLTLDGPLGAAGAGYLVSGRTGYPAVVAPGRESSYLRGATSDALATLSSPLFGGQGQLLAFASRNALDALAALAEDTTATDPDARNAFEWSSRSLGLDWRRRRPRLGVRVSAWHASSAARAAWAGRSGAAALDADRADVGAVATVDRSGAHTSSALGVRVDRMQTAYRFASDTAPRGVGARASTTAVLSLFAEQARTISSHLSINLGAALASDGSGAMLSPRVLLRWHERERIALWAAVARTHQFTQSLRNAESVVGAVFPTDLSVGSADAGVPVARSDLGVLAVQVGASAERRIVVQAFARRFERLVLVAPVEGEPFAADRFAIGSGTARGVSADLALTASRFALTAHYALQRVRLNTNVVEYTPEHAATHTLEAGLITFPTATTSIRLGGVAALGRRTTVIANGFEWESCNLVDRGCEFGGSPYYGGQPLGAAKLPGYLRLDAGVRQHVHLTLGGRDIQLAIFGTFTNLLGRHNVLTYATDPLTGRRVSVEMRRPSPLVVGIDWQF